MAIKGIGRTQWKANPLIGWPGFPKQLLKGLSGNQMKSSIASLYTHMQPFVQIRIEGDPTSYESFFKMVNEMGVNYKRIVWEEFRKAVPELHRKAGQYARLSGVPWDVLGRYAVIKTIPEHSVSGIKSVGGGPALTGGVSGEGMGTGWAHPGKGVGVSGLGPVGGKGYFVPTASGPIGFGFVLYGAELAAREALFEPGNRVPDPSSSNGSIQMEIYGGQPESSGWAIPQPGFGGAYGGPSPWFTQWNWPPRSGAKYPQARWLWREELGLAGKSTMQEVRSALESIGRENWWQPPPYTRWKMKRGEAIGGIKVGMQWIPPHSKGFHGLAMTYKPKRGKEPGLELGPGIMPKFFMRAACLDMSRIVAERCVKILGHKYQKIADKYALINLNRPRALATIIPYKSTLGGI